jgi:PncC family amidohydrolase
MLDNDSVTGTAFCVSKKELLSVFKDCTHKEIELLIKKEDYRLVFYLRGGNENQRRKAFDFIVKKFGSGCIRQGVILPAELAFAALRKANQKLVVAESCTGGLLATLLTDIPGSSQIFWGGFIVYSNEAKQELLGVKPDLLKTKGAVSREVTTALAVSAMKKTHSDISVAVSGIAGPEGGTPQKPVGTVWICVKGKQNGQICLKYGFSGSRHEVRCKTASVAFLLIESLILGGDYLDYSKNW